MCKWSPRGEEREDGGKKSEKVMASNAPIWRKTYIHRFEKSFRLGFYLISISIDQSSSELGTGLRRTEGSGQEVGVGEGPRSCWSEVRWGEPGEGLGPGQEGRGLSRAPGVKLTVLSARPTRHGCGRQLVLGSLRPYVTE